MTMFHDPTITDISKITTTMSSLKSLSFGVATALIGFLFPLEILHQNLRAMEGRNSYTGVFIRFGLVCLGLILYDQIFNFMVQVSTIMEFSILSEDQWSVLLAQLAQFFETRKVSFITSLPLVFTWAASFLAILAQTVMYWVRYCLLSVLYFVGPIAFAFLLFEPTSFLPKAWFKNVIQLAMWSVVMKIIVRIMLQLQVMTYLSSANANLDVMTLIGINTTFVVMVLLSPYFTSHFISGQTFGPFAVMASSVMTSKGFTALKGIGRSAAESWYFPPPENPNRVVSTTKATTKTAVRDQVMNQKPKGDSK